MTSPATPDSHPISAAMSATMNDLLRSAVSAGERAGPKDEVEVVAAIALAGALVRLADLTGKLTEVVGVVESMVEHHASGPSLH